MHKNNLTVSEPKTYEEGQGERIMFHLKKSVYFLHFLFSAVTELVLQLILKEQ